MRFSCNSKDLVNALSTATRVMAAHSPMEVLESLLLDADAEQNTITVTASDGNMTSMTTIPADIETDGIVLMPGRLFTDIVRKLPDGLMYADLSDRFVMTIKCAMSRFTVSGKPADAFPKPEEVEAVNCFELPEPMLKDMISTVSFAIPEEDTRKVLTGGCLNLKGGVMDLVGLDGFRMGMRTARISDTETSAKCIIPVRALDEICRLMSDDDSRMAKLHVGKNRLMAEAGSTKLYCALIEGEYIDYHRVVPAAFGVTAKVRREEFAGCVERAALIARQSKLNLLRFDIGEGSIVMSANSEAGDVREELEAEVSGSLSISFNVKYLSEIARVVSGDEIVLKMNNAVSPCVVSPAEGDSFTYLVLPVRTNA